MIVDFSSHLSLPKWAGASSLPAFEHHVETSVKLVFLGGWLALNLAMTIYNKVVLGQFEFPGLVTALHCTFTSVCSCLVFFVRDSSALTELDFRDNLALVAFSVLYTANIAISNISLALVTVPFHQMVRATCPVLTMLIYTVFLSRQYGLPTYLSTLPVVIGVALATYGDYDFTVAGLILTLFGAVIASVKSIVTNKFMTGSLALPPIELLLRMSPIAAIWSLVYAYFSGEIGRLHIFEADGKLDAGLCYVLAGNGFLAFLLSYSSFHTNKLAGALALSVAGNLKQCLTIALGIVLFGVKVGILNGLGMLFALFGIGWFSKCELDRKS